MHSSCSDEESIERSYCDLRWSAVLDLEPGERLCGKCTLQEFRARLHLNEAAEAQFHHLLKVAKKLGVLKGSNVKVAIDTTPVLGRGAVKDTYNLLGDGIRKLANVLAKIDGQVADEWAAEHDFSRYWRGLSLKGEAEIDWSSNDAERRVFLNVLVADAQRLLFLATEYSERVDEIGLEEIEKASRLLNRLISQDTEPDPDPSRKTEDGSVTHNGVRIRKGVTVERIVSVHDPEMRHGRKSASKRFDGYKLSLATDTDSGLILNVDILEAGASDSVGALDLIQATEDLAKIQVEKVIGDCAYGDGTTRQSFHDAGIELSAKVPNPPAKELFPKSRFILDLANTIATCPAGHSTREWEYYRHRHGVQARFRFRAEDCSNCISSRDCLRAQDKQRKRGRTIALHPQEKLLIAARQRQKQPGFREDTKRRQVAEQRLARMVQLGMRQARYFGKSKTKQQAILTAMVANLGAIANAA
jgi:IS5 family transposase